MIDVDQLLEHAATELPGGVGAPRQIDLRRAVSSAYYAVFHELCRQLADAFIGNKNTDAWLRVYRTPDHGPAKKQCAELAQRKDLDAGLWDFANAFVELQDKRHSCDYDPAFRITRAMAEEYVARARGAVYNLRQAAAIPRFEFLSYFLTLRQKR